MYGIPANNISVIKFGANLSVPQQPLPEKEYAGKLNFLFSGVGWTRKGGDIAAETIKILHRKGYDITFKIMGCTPDITEDYVQIIPFLDKNNPAELAEIASHLSGAHLLFVPTRTDCTPIAFCEAAGFSLPVISTDTGGVSATVEDGITGFLLPETADAEDYAELIEGKILNDRSVLPQLAANARHKYEVELNWQIWGSEMKKVLEKSCVKILK